MKILQNETTNNTTSTSATAPAISKEKHQHLTLSSQPQQQIAEKRKAKTLKNKILQNVAQQQQQQEEHQHQQRQQHKQNAIPNNKVSTPSAMTDERTKFSCNNTKANNSSTPEIITSTTTSPTQDSNLLKDSSSSGSIQNKNGSSNNNDLIIAEAAKILLKNGLNGTNAAAAAAVATATATLLTAAANFHQLPTTSNSTPSSKCNLTTTTSSISPTSASDAPTLVGNVTTAAATAHAQLVAIAAAAAAVNANNQKRLAIAAAPTSTFSTPTSSTSTCKSSNETFNNGLFGNIEAASATTATRTTVGTSTTAQFTKPFQTSSCKGTMSSSTDMDIIDHTITLNSNNASTVTSSSLPSPSSSSIINLSANNNSNNSNSNISQHQKFLNIHSNSNRSDIGWPPISQHHPTSNINNHKNSVSSGGYGGRLQFFKDGKFILELARSKDGEKGGWVSVPRKIFRTPSAATSSTVTPSPSAPTSVAAIPPSLSASPAAVVGGTTYPKNECSNSLSFSDDNSSLQSSPWQRDHCWKQAAPRKNISKELKLFYRRPAYHKFTAEALLLSQRKRRKPYDTRNLENVLIFLSISKKQQKKQQIFKSAFIKKEVEVKEEIKNAALVDKKENEKSEDGSIVSKTEIVDFKSGNNDSNEACEKSFNIKLVKIEPEAVENENVDVEMAKQLSPCNIYIKDEKSPKIQGDTTNSNDQCDKMNTSECSEEKHTNTSRSTPSNGDVLSDDVQNQHQLISSAQGDSITTGDEEKRLKKHENVKTGAKLTTIVQKLIDVSTSRLVATAHRFKTSNQTTSAVIALSASTPTSSSSTTNNTGLSSGGAKHQNSKVSPPNSAASRLVEYHQQHVSPRKRILREFEKVSLEDSSSGASGGKRSRAKGNATSATSANSIVVASSPSTTVSTSKSISLNAHNSQNAGNASKSIACVPPTKLYSSYSIHSLLGGGLSTSTTPTSAVKKSGDLPATITSSSMAYSSFHSASFPSSSLSSNSPKSPEGNNSMGGGKSPLNSAAKSKRSPPYSSPIRETPSRSPITCGSGSYSDYSGRRSPTVSTPDTAHNAFNKMRYASSGGIDTTASPSNHHYQQHHHLQQHYQQHPQTYYSPYMMSPHYVPPLPGPNALSPSASSSNASTSVTASSRSPRHLPSAFRATTPTSAASTTHNIPSTQKGDLSPPRSTTSSPRETAHRTVPKKTASIRRQFASPTSAATQNNSSNCSSPITTIDEQLMGDRRTPINSHQQHQQSQHLMQRSSPSNSSLAGSPIHPYSYLFTQPSNALNSSHTLNSGTGSNHPSSSMSPSSVNASAAVAAAAAAAAASYIPAVVGSPYYHPYISLAAMRHPQMWMQHYHNAAAAAANPALMQSRHPSMLSAAAARLSPPYHGFQYNGVSNSAALAAAAAAAAGFGGAATPPHPSSMFHSMANSLHGIQHSAAAMQAAGLVPAAVALSAVSPMTDANDLSKSSKNNFSSSTSSSTSLLGFVGNLSSGSPGNSLYTISNKDEQSSDVPLNLSKH